MQKRKCKRIGLITETTHKTISNDNESEIAKKKLVYETHRSL